MDILAEIKTCAETVGRDQQAVRDLYSALVHQELVPDAVDDYYYVLVGLGAAAIGARHFFIVADNVTADQDALRDAERVCLRP